MGLARVGSLAVVVALVAAAGSCGLAATGGARSAAAVGWSRRLLVGAASALTVALAALGLALVDGRWEVAYVADFASRSTRWPYRLSALWAGMAGSLLVWAWFLGLWGVIASRWCRSYRPNLAPTVQAVMAGLVAVFAGLLVWAASPFTLLDIPAIDGAGLTPVLRHPAMLYHPPLLYAGAVGLAVPFALSVAGRRAGGTARDWLAPARRWALVALGILSVGIVAGAHWAYVELGWGGYWAWDPVENGILLPWLAGVAFVHAAVREEAAPRHGGLKATSLAALTFGLGIFGAFLTRSGATSSVHAFAEARAVGWVLAAVLVGVVALWATGWLQLRRGAPPASGPRPPATRPPPRKPVSLEGALAANSALLMAVIVVVGVGTALPLVWKLVTAERLVVGGRYYALTTWPFALALLATVGVGTRVRSGGQWGGITRGRALWPAVPGAAVGLLGVVAVARGTAFTLVAATVGGAAAGLLVAEGRRRWRRPGLATVVAHMGVVVLLVGVAGTVAGDRRSGVLGPDQEVEVSGLTLRLEGIEAADPAGPGAAVTAEVAVFRGGSRVATLRPEALVSEAGDRVSVAGLRSTPIEDVMVILRSVGPDGRSAVVDVAVLPLAAWIWWGGLLVAAGIGLAARRPASGSSGSSGSAAGADRARDLEPTGAVPG